MVDMNWTNRFTIGLMLFACSGVTYSQDGIRRLESKHLILYTDLPIDNDIRELPAVFDKAISQWCQYFQVEKSQTADWRMTGHLIQDKQRFVTAGRIPEDLPAFVHGYQRGDQLWLYEQPSPYYRRHLLLHEGTHGFMNHFLNGAGPPWYMEGAAELLGTHRWEDKKLQLKFFPKDKRETPYWGRIEIIRRDREQGRPKSLDEIMQFDATAHRQVDAYAWCWAASAFLDGHPKSRAAFRGMRDRVQLGRFRFYRSLLRDLSDDWDELEESWRVFVDELEFGYSVARGSIFPKAETVPVDSLHEFRLRTDRSWQSSGLKLEAGQSYKIAAKGRYQVAKLNKDELWPCEAGGITIEYYRGRPLGMLLGAVQNGPSATPSETSDGNGLLAPIEIGLERTIVPKRSGTLFFRINEMPGKMADNKGSLSINIEKTQKSLLKPSASHRHVSSPMVGGSPTDGNNAMSNKSIQRGHDEKP